MSLSILLSKQSEVDAFYADCANDLFCFGTADTCTGTIQGLSTEEDGGDCAAYFGSHIVWGDPGENEALCDGTDKEACRAICPAGCTYEVAVTDNAEGVTAGRGFFNRASGCFDVNTGCKSVSELYSTSSEMIQELWAVGDVPAFTVVPTADETDTNSFSLFGGDSPEDTDHTDAPADQANPNDDVCLTGDCAQLFPEEATCTHVTDCVVEPSACTSSCEKAAERTAVITTPAAYGGAACPTEPQLADCAYGEGECVEPVSDVPPPSSGGLVTTVATSAVAAIVAGSALF